MTLRTADPDAELTWLVYSALEESRSWHSTEAEARAHAAAVAADPDTRGVVYVLRLVAVAS